MPKYDYTCGKCKHSFEQSYSTFSELEKTESKVKCPECGSKKKERQFPKIGSFQLKGKWFKQGY